MFDISGQLSEISDAGYSRIVSPRFASGQLGSLCEVQPLWGKMVAQGGGKSRVLSGGLGVGAIHESPLPILVTSHVQGRSRSERACFGGTCLSGLHDRRDVLVTSAFRRWIIHFASPGTTSVPLHSFGGTCLSGPHDRRDVLVTSAFRRWIIHFASPGTTSVPLHSFGGTCLSGPHSNVGSSLSPTGLQLLRLVAG